MKIKRKVGYTIKVSDEEARVMIDALEGMTLIGASSHHREIVRGMLNELQASIGPRLPKSEVREFSHP